VHAEVLGVSDRSGDTSGNGQVNFTAMQAGTYRVRFSGETVITFEKEVVLRAGQSRGSRHRAQRGAEGPRTGRTASASPTTSAATPGCRRTGGSTANAVPSSISSSAS
jgi:hypothetical protein